MKRNHPLMLMIKHKRENLLSHPVSVALIEHKWSKYGRMMYYSSFCLYLTFLLSFTTYVISIRKINWINENATSKTDLFRDAERCEDVDWRSRDMYYLQLVCKWVVMISVIIQIGKEISQLYQARISYLTSENLIEWICYIFSFIFVVDYHGCPHKEEWQWQLGALSIFLAWINFLLFIRVFPYFGIYVIMVIEVFTTFSSFFLLFFFFIVAFALSFYTVLGDQYAFRYPSLSVLRTSVMMIGEINYEEVFNNPDQPLEYPAVTYLLLITFMIIMSILIMNLLVGLAVDDIKAVQEQAVLQKLAMITELVLDIERAIPEYLRRRHNIRKMEVTTDSSQGVMGYLSKKLHIYEKVESNATEEEELRLEIQQMKRSVTSLLEVKSAVKDLLALKSSLEDLVGKLGHLPSLQPQEQSAP